jgi:hypothetical protein
MTMPGHISFVIILSMLIITKLFLKLFLSMKADLKKQRSLIPVVKYLLFNIDVDMVELGATNLIRSGDLEVINTFKKYADGEFTVEQKKWNNPLALEEFQEFSKKLLRENGIN